jgi:hypothetical protein
VGRGCGWVKFIGRVLDVGGGDDDDDDEISVEEAESGIAVFSVFTSYSNVHFST